jgi:LmbE family N-acetylglucosaminyl deacetylase
LLWSLLTPAAVAQSAPGSAVSSVFVTAHQDDWQLFMGSRAYDDVRRYGKVVFVIITAGQGDEPGETWWRAREMGCANSARTAANANASATPPRPTFNTVNVRGHQLTASYYRNTVVYFLRLPDGGVQGQGFARYNHQSLRKLRNRQINSISSIDGVNTYTSWDDLTSTVREVIRREVRTGCALWVNSSNPDVAHNPNDHPDHVATGNLTDDATRAMNCRRMLYMGYNTSRRPVNLNPTQTANQTALFAAYCRSMAEAGQPTGWQPDHLCWLGRQYSYLRHEAERPLTAATAAQRVADSLANIPSGLVLAVPTPNPCTMSSLLTYELPRQTPVTLTLYDLRGKEIKTLVRTNQRPGHYEVWLDVNQFPANGTYICRLQAGSEHREQRVQIER